VVSLSSRDEVALSESERLALAWLEESAKAEDPRLADRLAARPGPGWLSRLPLRSKWLPPLLVVAGLVALLWTVAASTWAASAAALVVTAGLWLGVEGYKARTQAKPGKSDA